MAGIPLNRLEMHVSHRLELHQKSMERVVNTSLRKMVHGFTNLLSQLCSWKSGHAPTTDVHAQILQAGYYKPLCDCKSTTYAFDYRIGENMHWTLQAI